MFVGQTADKLGRPQWMEVFKIDFSQFSVNFWQIMAECRDFVEKEGLEGYNDVVNEVSAEVAKFSVAEKLGNRGTIEDKVMSSMFYELISMAEPVYVQGRIKTGLMIPKSFFYHTYRESTKTQLNENRLKPFMTEMGFVEDQIKNQKCFFLKLDMNESDAKAHLNNLVNRESEEDEGIELPQMGQGTKGGF